MKHSNHLPRRVGTSLVKALCYYSREIMEADGRSTAFTEDGFQHPDYLRTNKRLIKGNDYTSCESIVKFYDFLRTRLEEQEVPQGGFITVAKSSQEKTKYVATSTSVGVVVTTATLKRILTLASTVLVGSTSSDGSCMSICEAQYNGYDSDSSPHFIRIADIIRYFDEVDVDVLEMSLDGIQYDYKLDKIHYGAYGYYRNTHASEVAEAKLSPMISDRYQDDSWEHYLKTLYSGVVPVNQLCPVLSRVNKTIALSELKGL